MEAVPELLTLRTDYTAKIDADLELVEKDRERVHAEITALQDQLHTLEGNHTLLLSLREALSDHSPTVRAESGPIGAATAGSTPAAPLVPDGVPHADGDTAPGSGQAAVEPEETPEAAKRKEPTLRDLVAGELKRRGEPCSSHDVATALARAHPGRRIKEPAMRHALEALVGQGRARRAKRGSRVFYLPASTPAPAGPAGNDGAVKG